MSIISLVHELQAWSWIVEVCNWKVYFAYLDSFLLLQICSEIRKSYLKWDVFVTLTLATGWVLLVYTLRIKQKYLQFLSLYIDASHKKSTMFALFYSWPDSIYFIQLRLLIGSLNKLPRFHQGIYSFEY